MDNDTSQIIDTANLKEGQLIELTAGRSVDQLNQHRKLSTQEYSERVRRLRKIMRDIRQRDTMGVLPLEGLDKVTISEEDLALVYNPIAGL